MKPGGEKDFIMLIHEVLSPELCQSLLRTFEASSEKSKGMVYGADGSLRQEEVKDSIDLPLSEDFKEYRELNEAVWQAFRLYAACYPGLSSQEFTNFGYKIQKYEKGKGQFKWHCDATTPSSYHFQVAMVLYLNDVSEGGETAFAHQQMSFSPQAGSLLFFPTFWTHPHMGAQPLSEDKYIINTFFGFINKI